MFPAYGGGGGGGRGGPPPFVNQGFIPPPWGKRRRSRQATVFDSTQLRTIIAIQSSVPPQAGPSFQFMLDRGGGPPMMPPHHGGNRGRGHHNSRYEERGDRRHDHRHSGGNHQDVVEINSSDDDNYVEDAVRGNRRKRNRSKSSSRSHKRRRDDGNRSRSRSPKHSRHHHHDHRHGRDDRGNGGNNRHDNRNQYQNQGNRRDQGGYHQNRNQNYDRRNDRRQQQPQPGYSGPWNSNEPAPPGTESWALDNNPFDQFQRQRQRRFEPIQRDPYARPGFSQQDFIPRNPHDMYGRNQQQFQNSPEMQEMRRVQVSQQCPNRVFLEDVNLDSSFAFRLDTSCNEQQIRHRSIAMNQKSQYEGGVGKGIFGASEDEITKVYTKFHPMRCKLPDRVQDSEDLEQTEEGENEKKQRNISAAETFFSLDKEGGHRRSRGDRMDIGRDFDSYSFERKDGEMSVKEKIEYYNKEVRNQPQNVNLWKEFVQFQDKVYEESNQIYEQDVGDQKRGKKKNKSNRKALLEKKISILEKALESNPKNLSLHMMRLEYLLELEKPKHVLTEWKKLVTQHQQMAAFWIEYLLFSSSQLMIYSNTTIVSVFDTCFQKLRLMMNPQYPDFQRPNKFPLFVSDLTFGLSLLLRNAGFLERAVSLHQAQLEFDFYCPKQLFKDDTLLNWRDETDIFDTFWDAGTPRFGEINAKGWLNVLKDTPKERIPIAIPDSKISDFEDDIFDHLNEEIKADFEKQENTDESSLLMIKQNQKPNIWVNIESCRSKLYWLPWRKSCSDVDDCEDAQRVVLASDINNFICPIPCGVNYIDEFSRQAAYFRHVVNFLITLREDFIPHTQTVDLVCSPFRAVSLTESSSLFSEIYYWRKLADLYVGVNNSEPASKEHHVFAPEGFKFEDLTSPSIVTAAVLKPTLFDVSLKGQDENSSLNIDEKKSALLKENDTKFMQMFYNVVEAGIELLDPEFSCLLFELFLRFEQKQTCSQTGDVKQRIKFAKGLMKNDKIRNSIGGYREMAMLEYYGSGNAQKAIDLLIKSINVTGKSLNLQEWDQVDWEKNWKSVVDLVSLYRQLAELYLYDRNSINDSKAYYTLVQLGNVFQSLEPDSLEFNDEVEQHWKPKTNALLKATRGFEKIMEMLVPNFSLEEESGQSSEIKEICNESYFKWGGDKGIEFLLQQKNFIVEWTSCYALFQFFGKDFEATCLVYENMLRRLCSGQLNRRDSYDPELIRVHIREQLYINWCNLAARCLVKDPLMNAKFRNILGKALEEFPSSPPLLLLFIDVENQTSVAGKLWRLMMANLKQDSDKIITHWAPLIMGIGLARKIEELEHDEEVGLPCFGLGGPAVPQDTIFYKLDSMISVAEQHPGARHCPLLWRVHLKLLALRAREGKDIQRARATFYDAIRHCPSAKALYLDGVTYFPDLLQEVNDLLAEKQLLIRLPIEELDVLLEMDEDGGHEVGGEVDHPNDDDIVEVDPKGMRLKVGKSKSRESKSEGEIESE